MNLSESANVPQDDDSPASGRAQGLVRAHAKAERVASTVAMVLAGGGDASRAHGTSAGTVPGGSAAARVRNLVAERVHSVLTAGDAQRNQTSGVQGMSGESSIHYQLELLASLQGYLRQVQSDLDGMVQQYALQLDQLGEAGMTSERLRHFQASVFAETRAEFIRLIERLQAVDHVQVRSYQAWLEEELGRY